MHMYVRLYVCMYVCMYPKPYSLVGGKKTLKEPSSQGFEDSGALEQALGLDGPGGLGGFDVSTRALHYASLGFRV